MITLTHENPTTSRKGWAPLSMFSKQYRMPDGEWLAIRCFEDIDAWEKAWADARGEALPAETFAPNTGGSPDQQPADPIKKAREAEAIRFIAEYKGTFAFILDLRARREWGSKWYRLTERQVDAVLRVKANDEARTKERVQTGRNLTAVLPVGRTAAAVTNDEGHTTFLLIDIPAEKSKWTGWAFVKQYIGGIGEGKRLGSQRPGETYVGQWANLIDRVLADPMEAVARFGRELGICGVCMAPLTNEESREYGIGPVCRGKIKE